MFEVQKGSYGMVEIFPNVQTAQCRAGVCCGGLGAHADFILKAVPYVNLLLFTWFQLAYLKILL